MNGRERYIDVAKAIAMILVVRIHTEVFSVVHVPYPIIAVPFFFFLSGFYDNSSLDWRNWSKKNVKLLYITIIWMVVGWLYLSLLGFIKSGQIEVPSISIYSPIFGIPAVWFLPALFIAKLITKLLDGLCNRYLLLAIIVLCGGFVSQHNLPLLIDEGLAALVFYYSGKVLYPRVEQWSNKMVLSSLGMVCIFMMMCSWFPYVFVPYDASMFLFVPFYCIILLSFISILSLTKRISHYKWLADYGTKTLGILVLHPLLLHTSAVILNRLCIYGSFIWIICFIVAYIAVCILCYFITLLIEKYIPILFIKRKLYEKFV